MSTLQAGSAGGENAVQPLLRAASSACSVGRVGALAVALGVGVWIASTPAIAAAESAEARQGRGDAHIAARRRHRPQCRGAGPVGSGAGLWGRIERSATRRLAGPGSAAVAGDAGALYRAGEGWSGEGQRCQADRYRLSPDLGVRRQGNGVGGGAGQSGCRRGSVLHRQRDGDQSQRRLADRQRLQL